MHSLVTVVDSNVVCTCKLLRVDIKSSHHRKGWQLCNVIEVLTNAMVVIILQYLSASSQYIICFKLTQLYLFKLAETTICFLVNPS